MSANVNAPAACEAPANGNGLSKRITTRPQRENPSTAYAIEGFDVSKETPLRTEAPP